MMIHIEQEAYKWFETEFHLPKPYHIRLYPQYAGMGTQHRGFSLAFALEEPTIAETEQTMDGITFYVESNDAWFFDHTNVDIKYCSESEEIVAQYQEV